MSSQDRTFGSDVVVDVLLRMGIDQMSINPSATLRGMHDSIVNTDAGSAMNLVLCCHEEIAVAVAHGYAKASGSPMAVAVGNIVGLQHASMAIYNAWSDRVPMLVFSGAGPLDAATRRPHVDWVHATIDQGRIVSEIVKWSDQPLSVESLVPSMVRAYRITTTKPMAPVHIALDTALQEKEAGLWQSPLPDKYAAGLRIGHAADDVDALADRLASAGRPVIVVGRVEDRTEAVVRLAEMLRAPVIDVGQRLGIPWDHELDLSDARQEILPQADVVLALEVKDLHGRLHTTPDPVTRAIRPIVSEDAAVLRVGLDELITHGYGQFQFQRADVDVVAEPEPVLDDLIDALEAASSSAEWESRPDWWSAPAERVRSEWEATLQTTWGSSPIANGRLASELDAALGDRDVLLAHNQLWPWPNRTWKRRSMRFLGLLQFAAVALGYGPGIATGAGIAAKRTGETVVCIDGDGDFLYTPSALWTAAAQRVPVLFVVLNNSAYAVDIHHQLAIARGRGRSTDNPVKGLDLEAPSISFTGIARGFGVFADDAVSDPSELAAVLGRALEHVDGGFGPALVEVITER
jgi:thiamine pyrophosphate-dependent acetolactate synthase large subunit-like protein